MRTAEEIIRCMEEMAGDATIGQAILEFNEMTALEQRYYLNCLVDLANHPYFSGLELYVVINLLFKCDNDTIVDGKILVITE